MRIGIMGLGRIGAFHAETLAGLEAVDSLVVTDPVAAAACLRRGAVRGHGGGLPRRGAGRRCGRRGDRRRDRRAPRTHSRRRQGGHPGLLREARGPRCRGEPRRAACGAGRRGRGAHRLQPALRRRLRRRAPGRGERRTRTAAHRTVHHPGPRAAARRVRGRLRRHLPRLQRARLRHRALGHRPRGRRGVRDRRQPGRATTSRRRATSTPPPHVLTFDDGTIGVISNSRHNARGYDVRLEVHGIEGQHRRGP